MSSSPYFGWLPVEIGNRVAEKPGADEKPMKYEATDTWLGELPQKLSDTTFENTSADLLGHVP